MIEFNNSYEVIITKIFIEKNVMNNKKTNFTSIFHFTNRYINYILFKREI